MLHIAAPRPDQLPRLQEIEDAAGCWFAEIGMVEIAEDPPAGIETLEGYRVRDMAWVATPDTAGDAVAYLLADTVDGNLHIEQLTVHPDWARRGIGRILIEHLAEVGRANGVPALTLTTFAEVPWNAPYYARIGFDLLDDAALGEELRAVRLREAQRGLDRWRRVCMRRTL